MNDITATAQDIIKHCLLEYADVAEEAMYEMAQAQRHLGWSNAEVEELLAELGF